MYEYRCDACGVFAAMGKMSTSSEPTACPDCNELSERILSAPRLAILGTAQRSAHERNEKSAHEPCCPPLQLRLHWGTYLRFFRHFKESCSGK
ncbi:FmdB family zinc ribbon protein [Methylobacillus glycogenes]|uniref:FmdB family zinc ribbon protein n=1 Tax=Methylobacillus glycogenes TaxID=406 RepID=UPI00227709F9|nr:FmdB family zinc ribbon protein [Methylobacillus glycogenes]